MVKLTPIQRQVLGHVQFNGRINQQELARQLGVNHLTVIRIVDKFFEKSLLVPALRVGVRTLGFRSYHVWCRLSAHGASIFESLVSTIASLPEVSWAYLRCGDYDMSFRINLAPSEHIDNFIAAIVTHCGSVFAATSALECRWWYSFQMKHLHQHDNANATQQVFYKPVSRPVSYDCFDLEIVSKLAKNPLLSCRKLAEELNRPFQTVHNRISNLATNGVTLGVECAINHNQFGIQRFAVLLKVENITPEIEARFIEFCRGCPFVVAVGHFVEDWNYELEIEVRDCRELCGLRLALLSFFKDSLTGFSIFVAQDLAKTTYGVTSTDSSLLPPKTVANSRRI
jgi:DNA-binding Lrp family transcriptional regulator